MVLVAPQLVIVVVMMPHLCDTSKLKTATKTAYVMCTKGRATGKEGKKEREKKSFIWRKLPDIHSAQVAIDGKH